MTAQSHLKRYPSARSSTLAYLEKRQQTTEQLRREIGISKPRPWWAFWRKR
jgi:SOS response regulatory protein OraA/RecX